MEYKIWDKKKHANELFIVQKGKLSEKKNSRMLWKLSEILKIPMWWTFVLLDKKKFFMEECKCINQEREERMLHCTEIVGKFA